MSQNGEKWATVVKIAQNGKKCLAHLRAASLKYQLDLEIAKKIEFLQTRLE